VLGIVSHDLRNPLQSIAAATMILQREPQTDETAENIAAIAEASAEMQRLVEDLLDVSTIEAGRLLIHKEEVALPDLMSELQTIVSPQVKALDARIEVLLAPDLPPVAIDRHRILQVLLNLVGNALKFGAQGGLVTLGAERCDEAIRIWVQDTGEGIGSDELSKVFDRFWRADQGSGVGLGLALAKGIVEAHGGQIGVTSQPGAGSVFFFTLPHSHANAVPTQEGPPGHEALLNTTLAT